MTQIDDLQAGRELDALVAEKVMGWKSVAMAGLFTQFLATALCGLPSGAQFNDELQIVPRYSTHIAAAWEVVEKLRLVIRPSLLHSSKLQWIVGQLKGVRASGLIEISKETYVEAETAPLAICKAALKAIGE